MRIIYLLIGVLSLSAPRALGDAVFSSGGGAGGGAIDPTSTGACPKEYVPVASYKSVNGASVFEKWQCLPSDQVAGFPRGGANAIGIGGYTSQGQGGGSGSTVTLVPKFYPTAKPAASGGGTTQIIYVNQYQNPYQNEGGGGYEGASPGATNGSVDAAATAAENGHSEADAASSDASSDSSGDGADGGPGNGGDSGSGSGSDGY